MTDALIARHPSEVDPSGRQPWARRTVTALVATAAVLGAFGLGLATAEVRTAADGAASLDEAASTDLSAPAGETAGSVLEAPDLQQPWLDVEFDFLGAVATWPRVSGATTTDPFRDTTDASLVAAGRTVCTRAGDGMDADGIGDLLDTTPHQTYVLVTEAIDKLCPSQRTHRAALRS